MKQAKQNRNIKNKMVVKSVFALVMLIALALSVYSAPHSYTLNTLTWSENTKVNMSVKTANDDSQLNVSSILIRFSASNTANSSTSVIINLTNSSATNFDFGYANFTFGNDLVLEDTNVGSVTALSTGNGDSQNINLSATTVTIDRTAPSTPTSLTLLSTNATIQNQDVSISATVGGANTTGCVLTFVGTNPGSSSYSMTHSGNDCTQSFTRMPETTYRYYMTATDVTNTSGRTSENQFTINIRTSTAKKAYIISGGQLPQQASTTAQQRAFGQQATSRIDELIARAPPNAQKGLMKAKESIAKQYKGREAVKTWTGTGIGCAVGLSGLVIPPLGLITVPAGCVVGHLGGMVV